MAVKKSTQYKIEGTRETFQLELKSGDIITFGDPNKISTEKADDLARAGASKIFKMLLSDEEYAKFWEEFRSTPQEETGALLNDVMEHYGASPGK